VWNFLTTALNSAKGGDVSAANVIFWNVFPFAMPYGFDGSFPQGNISLLTELAFHRINYSPMLQNWKNH
jgi:hypothetical protein